ncbi:MAG: glycosyltransferase family 4 protein [Acidobacteria bacterium]|nr:glycosyltransferase family 4 protein [Acidobacteriota bacterium]MBP7475341.1 glycosyltransferase family 4 protein [Pyrinomonadaceae bacterium]
MGEIPVQQTNPAKTHENTLWVLTEVYYPEEISTGYYLTSIAEGIAADRDVKVITGQPKHMSRGMLAPKRETRNGVEIFRVWGTTLDKNVMAFRLTNMLTIGLSVFFHSVKHFKKGDRILVCTAPPSLPVTTTLATLLKGAGLTLLVQDSYPEILIAVGSAKPDSFFVNLVNHVNRWVYKYATNIVVMGRDMNELFQKKAAGLEVPIVTIPNWADLETIHPTPRAENPLLKELGIEDKFVFMYAGNIGHPTDVETIIGAAELLLADDRFHFVFIGAGAKKKWLDEIVAATKLANVTILDYRPRSEQNVFLNACDVGLVALIKGMWGTAMPSRTYNIMAAGKPILALTDKGSELARVIDEDSIGVHLEPGNPKALKEAILAMFQSRDELDKMGQRAREAALAKYSTEIAVAAYGAAVE